MKPPLANARGTTSAIRDLKMAKSGSKKGRKGRDNKKGVFAFFVVLAFFACTLRALISAGSSVQPLSLSQIWNPEYVEPGACAECHREIAESYARTAMARTFGAVQSENDFPELKRGAFHHDATEESFTVYARDGRPYIQRRQVGFDGAVTNVFEARVDYRIGSGNHARSYISRTKPGKLIELPGSWYAENGGYWAMSP